MILTGIFFPLYHPSFIFLCWSVSLFSYSFRLPLPHHWLNQKVPHTLLLTEVAGILLYILLSLSPSLHHTMVIILNAVTAIAWLVPYVRVRTPEMFVSFLHSECEKLKLWYRACCCMRLRGVISRSKPQISIFDLAANLWPLVDVKCWLHNANTREFMRIFNDSRKKGTKFQYGHRNIATPQDERVVRQKLQKTKFSRFYNI